MNSIDQQAVLNRLIGRYWDNKIEQQALFNALELMEASDLALWMIDLVSRVPDAMAFATQEYRSNQHGSNLA